AARRASASRWLMYPLSVISLASIDGTSGSSNTRAIRSDEPRCAAFHRVIAACTCSRTAAWQASSASGASLPISLWQPAAFGQAAVEHDALAGIGGVGKPHRVARLVEAVLVEGGGGEVGAFPIARRHVRPAHAHFELAARRHELELDARHRHADRARQIDDET